MNLTKEMLGDEKDSVTLQSSIAHKVVGIGVLLTAWVLMVLGTFNEPTSWVDTFQTWPHFYFLFFFGPLVFCLNIWFRSIQFTRNGIEVNRWYWPKKQYRYDEVISVEANSEKTLKIHLTGGVIRIPEYLLNFDTATKLYGLDITRLLQARCNKKIEIKVTH